MFNDMKITPEEARSIMRVHGLTPHKYNDHLNMEDAKLLKYIGTGYLKNKTSQALKDTALYAIQKSSEQVEWSGGPRQKDVIGYIREMLDIKASHVTIRRALDELIVEDLVQINDVTKKTVLYSLKDKGLARYQEIAERFDKRLEFLQAEQDKHL